MESGAAWNSKQDLADRIEKVKKKYFKIGVFNQYILEKIGKTDLKYHKNLDFS